MIRTVGDDHEPRQFSTWSPCAIAMIGRLPETLSDRSVAIGMRRRSHDEQVDRLRSDRPQIFEEVRRRLARFAADARHDLEHADPHVPEHLHDRAADNWRALLAVADAAGGHWPERARAACMTLHAGEIETDTLGVALLKDIRLAFASKGDPVRLSSQDLCRALAEDEASPWAAFGKQERPITPPALARLLKAFRIAPKMMRDRSQLWRGYERVAFADAWTRYLNPEAALQSATPQQSM